MLLYVFFVFFFSSLGRVQQCQITVLHHLKHKENVGKMFIMSDLVKEHSSFFFISHSESSYGNSDNLKLNMFVQIDLMRICGISRLVWAQLQACFSPICHHV